VVFDCDGVLANTTRCWDEAFERAARLVGLQLGPPQLIALHGAAVSDAGRRLADWAGRGDAADDVVRELDEQLFKSVDEADLTALGGVAQLLAELHGWGVPLGVASNAPRRVLLHVLSRLDLVTYFSCAVSADDVDHPKPSPNPYLAACRALWADPGRSVAVEDSQIGVTAARAAGLMIIEVGAVSSEGDRNNAALRVVSLADTRVAHLILGRDITSVVLPTPDDAGSAKSRQGESQC
jgi:HAD superfamily hydrolase (TIGR01509 family)